MLQSDFKYFTDNHDSLYREYPDKYLIIKDGRVLFAEDSLEAALEKAVGGGLEVGSFLLQFCSEGDKAYTQTFHSRVIFA